MKVTDVIKFDEGVIGSRIGGGTKCIGTGWGDGISEEGGFTGT